MEQLGQIQRKYSDPTRRIRSNPLNRRLRSQRHIIFSAQSVFVEVLAPVLLPYANGIEKFTPRQQVRTKTKNTSLSLTLRFGYRARSRSPFAQPTSLGTRSALVHRSTGWALNVAWPFTSQRIATNDPSQASGDTLSIAMRFGWACPAVLVFLTWLVWRFKTRRAP